VEVADDIALTGCRGLSVDHRLTATDLLWRAGAASLIASGPAPRGFGHGRPSRHHARVGTAAGVPDGACFAAVGAATLPIEPSMVAADSIVYWIGGNMDGWT
jgi:hypothetical protein